MPDYSYIFKMIRVVLCTSLLIFLSFPLFVCNKDSLQHFNRLSQIAKSLCNILDNLWVTSAGEKDVRKEKAGEGECHLSGKVTCHLRLVVLSVRVDSGRIEEKERPWLYFV